MSVFQYVRLELAILAAWTLVLAALFLAGWVLNRKTLREVRRRRTVGYGNTGTAERSMRRVYRAVIAAASLCFYLTFPLLVVLASSVAVRVVYGFFYAGRTPLLLLAGVGAVALLLLFAVFRSLFARSREEEPGRAVSRREAPRLWALVEDVARRVGTRPVGRICVTPGTEIAVLERGGPLRKLAGRGRRYLLLGLGALPGLRSSQFEAILAHEYGHFSNRDTAGGEIARRVLHSMQQTGLTLAVNGLDAWYNPAWWFLRGFSRLFVRITVGASRLQETLADRYAAMVCGVRPFVEGLEHIVYQSLVFTTRVANEVESAQRAQRNLLNVYTLPPIDDPHQRERVEQKYAEVMTCRAAPDDSHPSPRERIELLQGLEAPEPRRDDTEMWELMGDAAALQREMTRVIQNNVDAHRAMPPVGDTVANRSLNA